MTTRLGSLKVRLAVATLCGALPIGAMLATAAPPGGGLRSQTEEQRFAPGRTIRLNYYEAKWDKVLKDFALKAGLTVEAERLPTKKFTRLDVVAQNLDDAFKYLEVELEKLGYKLTVEDTKLVVTQKKTLRQDYARAVPAKPAAAPVSDIERVPAPPKEFAAETIRKAPRPQQTAAATPKKVVQQTSAEESARKQPAPKPKAVKPAPKQTATVKVEHQPVLRIARNIYDSFLPHAKLVEEGPKGLPAFHILSTDESETAVPRIIVGIDEPHSELIIQAGHQDLSAATRLVELLDVAPQPGKATRAVATTKDADRVAEALQPELDKLARLPRKVRVKQLAQVQRGQEDQPINQPQDPNQPEDPNAPPAPRGRSQTVPVLGGQIVVDDLKGQVDIESMPELGVLILRGNKEDVDKVMAVIRQIEQLSIGTAPDVEIIFLQEVSAEGLALLLTDVYTRLGAVRTATTQQTQSVSIIPLARPNALMVLASKADMDDVRDLARKLDRPSDPENEYRVFNLKYAIAPQVVTRIAELYPAATTSSTTAIIGGQVGQAAAGTTTAGLSPRIRVTADVRMNSVIVQARPRDLEEIASLISDLDQGRPEAVTQIKVFSLENAVAEELANVLTQAIQSTINPQQFLQQGQQGINTGFGAQGQGSQELRDAKSTVLQFLQVGDDGERDLRSGFLSDIRVSSDARTNSLVVTAPEESMDLMAALVRQFDQPSNAIADIKVFTLINSDASTMVQMLTDLFTGQQQGGQNAQNQGAQGILVAGASDISSSLIPLRFSPDTRTNSIIAVGGAEALRVVEAVLLRLDQAEMKVGDVFVYKLRNSPAQEVSDAINNFLTSQRDILTANTGLISPFEQLDREVIVVPEIVTNSLIIAATPRYLKRVQEIIAKLDIAPQQVMIQALLVEVTLDNADEMGVELGFQDSILFSRGNPTPGFNFNSNGTATPTTPTLGTTPFLPEVFAGQALSNFNMGRSSSTNGFGGLVLSGGNESISVLIRALASRQRTDILSRPQVYVADNQLAQIQVGQQISRINGFTPNTVTGNTPTTEIVDIGLILQVIPRITPEGQVVMELVATKSSLGPNQEIATGVFSPIINITTARTTLSVQDGQTVVMGGMITKQEDHTERKVPVLGDIPVLGIPFRFDSHNMVRTELMIFLTPRILSNYTDQEMLKQIEMDRLNFIECEMEAMHGPLRAFDNALNSQPGAGNVYQQLNPGPSNQSVWPALPPATYAPQLLPDSPAVVPPTSPPPAPDTSLDSLPPEGPVVPQGGKFLKPSSGRTSKSKVAVSVQEVPAKEGPGR